MADHPLRPATDRRLGGPLPRQQANRTRANPSAINLSPESLPGVSGISSSFLKLFRTKGYVPTRYSPVCRSPRGALDLHVLSLPPAFVLSQDQTLKFNLKDPIPTGHVLVKLEDRTLLKRPRLLSTSSKRIRLPLKKRPPPRQPASRPSSRSGAPQNQAR